MGTGGGGEGGEGLQQRRRHVDIEPASYHTESLFWRNASARHLLVTLAACFSPWRAHRADGELANVGAGECTNCSYPAQGPVGGGPGRRCTQAFMQWDGAGGGGAK
jgi:hypothetical protein